MRDGHDCYHCDRPENLEPFVIPGTPVELYSSEMDAGRWRHWGGSDLWLCREHRSHVGDAADPADPRRFRTMEVAEAAEHAVLHRHHLLDDARALERILHQDSLNEFEMATAARLAELDRGAPHGGHAAGTDPDSHGH